MNEQEHIERHKKLHVLLDELVADFIAHTDGRPSTTTVLELMQWAHQQTISPSQKDEGDDCGAEMGGGK